MTLSPKKGESLRLKNDEKDDEKPPIIIDDGTEIDDIIKGNSNLCQKIDVMNNYHYPVFHPCLYNILLS